MNKLLCGAAVLALSTGSAFAAGLDRSGQSVGAIFNDDGEVNLSFGLVLPTVKGKDALGNSYDVGENYNQTFMSYTNSIGEGLSYAVIFDQPYGANVDYNNSPLTSTLGGTGADLSSNALSFVLKYNLTDRISVFGGIKAQSVKAEVNLNGLAYQNAISASAVAQGFNARLPAGAPQLTASELGGALATLQAGDPTAALAINARYGSNVVFDPTDPTSTDPTLLANAFGAAAAGFAATDGYKFEMESSTRPGYLIGAAYEIPEIAFRLAATYHGEIEHKADTEESLIGTNFDGTVKYKTPRSLNLEFQTGIAQDTLLTASYRWTEFSATDVIPELLGTDLVNLEDAERYTLGVARRFNEALAGSLTLSYEPEGDDLVSPLGPTNGLFGVTVGMQYSKDNVDLSGGINYSWLGDAEAEVGGTSQASFEDSHVVGVGFKAAFKF